MPCVILSPAEGGTKNLKGKMLRDKMLRFEMLRFEMLRFAQHDTSADVSLYGELAEPFA
jgi:hypothetical protein